MWLSSCFVVLHEARDLKAVSLPRLSWCTTHVHTCFPVWMHANLFSFSTMHPRVSLTQHRNVSHHTTISKHIKIVSFQRLQRQLLFIQISNKHQTVPINKMFGQLKPKMLGWIHTCLLQRRLRGCNTFTNRDKMIDSAVSGKKGRIWEFGTARMNLMLWLERTWSCFLLYDHLLHAFCHLVNQSRIFLLNLASLSVSSAVAKNCKTDQWMFSILHNFHFSCFTDWTYWSCCKGLLMFYSPTTALVSNIVFNLLTDH